MFANRVWHCFFSVVSFLSFAIAGMAVSGQITAGDFDTAPAVGEYSAITNFEARIDKVSFAADNRHHALRKARIDYYVDLARNSARQGWGYQEQDAIRRAKLILDHHVAQGLNDNEPG
ncbi:hypothetical protein [Alteromonas halophila]|uniref:DUF4148 domain-containing protein n=1 Tax=Alteromonas halophila TaxID=516698 RepID=A0A918N0L6_9ALTE|nr:hypothetical protein [Alteromonas halophila]GGW89990.1 hypothetical protein GCM10007391_25420 [Alteromonas halophila]